MIHPIFAYIGPGAGFAFLGSFLTLVLSVLASDRVAAAVAVSHGADAVRRRRGMRRRG